MKTAHFKSDTRATGKQNTSSYNVVTKIYARTAYGMFLGTTLTALLVLTLIARERNTKGVQDRHDWIMDA